MGLSIGFRLCECFELVRAGGHRLTLRSEQPSKELSFNEKIEKIQKYLPKGLTEKIL